MFKTIVWATDGSEAAHKALWYAEALAREEGRSLVVTHSAEVFAPSRAMGVPMYQQQMELEEALPRLVANLKDSGIDASLRIVQGIGVQPAHAIAGVAREVGAELIVIGTRGHTAFSGLLLGSVTQRLLHVAPCPVLAVPPIQVRGGEQDGASETAGVAK